MCCKLHPDKSVCQALQKGARSPVIVSTSLICIVMTPDGPVLTYVPVTWCCINKPERAISHIKRFILQENTPQYNTGSLTVRVRSLLKTKEVHLSCVVGLTWPAWCGYRTWPRMPAPLCCQPHSIVSLTWDISGAWFCLTQGAPTSPQDKEESR